MLKHLTFLLAFLCLATRLLATHNYSGEIIYQKTGDLGLQVTIITYTNAASVNADRDSLFLAWGDGITQQIARSNGPNNTGELVAGNIKKNVYIGQHTYAVAGIYWLSMTDPNRSADILNVNPPASDNVPFHLEAMVRLLPDAAGSVYSPIFLEKPVDEAVLGQPFEHVPDAFDADGDSLTYELAVPMQGAGALVPNYLWPNQIAAGPNNQISLNAATGKFTWNAPQLEGHYVIAITVRAYRNGLLVEETRRDMLIEVEPGFNSPPVIALSTATGEEEIIEVTVGQTIQLEMTASDANAGQNLVLSASSGLFENFFQEKATFTTSVTPAVFSWTVKSEHVRDQPYQVVFKAKDGLGQEGLASYRIVRFQVNALSGVYGSDAKTLHIRLFPNPNPGTFRVELPEAAQQGMTLRVLHIGGKLLQEQAAQTGTRIQVVRTQSLPAGTYLLQVVLEGKPICTEKFLKD